MVTEALDLSLRGLRWLMSQLWEAAWRVGDRLLPPRDGDARLPGTFRLHPTITWQTPLERRRTADADRAVRDADRVRRSTPA